MQERDTMLNTLLSLPLVQKTIDLLGMGPACIICAAWELQKSRTARIPVPVPVTRQRNVSQTYRR